MKLLHRKIFKGEGTVVLLPEEREDLWTAYQLISKGDRLKSSTFRKVAVGNKNSESSSSQSQKVRTVITIEVVDIDFEIQDQQLRVRGKNVEENEHLKIGSFHTLDIDLNRKFSLTKHEWDSISFDIMRNACDITKSADLAAVVMHEGLANLCLISNSMTLVRAKIELSIPRKRKNFCMNHDKAIVKFFDQLVNAIVRHIDFEVVKVCVIGSPGFTREQFFDHMMATAGKQVAVYKTLIENRSKFVLAHCSSGFKSAVSELLKDPAISKQLADTKAVRDVRDLSTFYQLLYTDPARAFYGLAHVSSAADAGAIDILMISDEFLRKSDLARRKRLAEIIDTVKGTNGNVRIFSVLHPSGEQLNSIGGVAAILRYPMDDILAMDDGEPDQTSSSEEDD